MTCRIVAARFAQTRLREAEPPLQFRLCRGKIALAHRHRLSDIRRAVADNRTKEDGAGPGWRTRTKGIALMSSFPSAGGTVTGAARPHRSCTGGIPRSHWRQVGRPRQGATDLLHAEVHLQ
jgi:hypothetical protein